MLIFQCEFSCHLHAFTYLSFINYLFFLDSIHIDVADNKDVPYHYWLGVKKTQTSASNRYVWSDWGIPLPPFLRWWDSHDTPSQSRVQLLPSSSGYYLKRTTPESLAHPLCELGMLTSLLFYLLGKQCCVML